MKKFIKSLCILLLVAFVFSLAACDVISGILGGSNPNGNPEQEQTPDPTPDPTPTPTPDPDPKPEPTPTPDPEPTPEPTPTPGEIFGTGRWFDDETSNQNSKFYKDYSAEEKQLYYTLWKEDTAISVKVDVSPYELAKLDEAYSDYCSTGNSTKIDTYRRCNLEITVNGTTYSYQEVGIRMHGNTSKRNFCNSDGQIYAFVHFRFNLSETFDGEEYAEGTWAHELEHVWTNSSERSARKDRSFATLEKFMFKWNKNYDNTYVREVYANKVFQAYGVLAPHVTLSQLSLKQNGQFENLGVGTFYETVDKHFINRYFAKPEKGGDLYKCGYPADLTTADGRGVETPTQRFTYSLKTNDDRTSETYNHHKYLIALVDMLNGLNKNQSDFKEKLESLVDMDYFTRFEAVNYLLGNPDCIRNNRNNYYMYFIPESGKVFFIPYDYDRCLGINRDWNPSGDGMMSLRPFDVNGANGPCTNPLYLKTILNGGSDYYRNVYKTALTKVLDGKWFQYDTFQKTYLAYKQNYQNSATPSQQIISQCSWNIDAERFVFSEDGTNQFDSTADNISTKIYMEHKRLAALAALN